MPQYSILEYSLGDVVRADKALSEPILVFLKSAPRFWKCSAFQNLSSVNRERQSNIGIKDTVAHDVTT